MSRYLTNLAGANFRATECRAIVESLEPGETSFKLEREGSNAFDPNAIKVHFLDRDGDEWFIGYCEKIMNADLAEEMDNAGDDDLSIKVAVLATYPNEDASKTGRRLKPLLEILTGPDAE